LDDDDGGRGVHLMLGALWAAKLIRAGYLGLHDLSMCLILLATLGGAVYRQVIENKRIAESLQSAASPLRHEALARRYMCVTGRHS
jgi:hypothetical protein